MKIVLGNPAELVALGAPRVIHNDGELAVYTKALFQLTIGGGDRARSLWRAGKRHRLKRAGSRCQTDTSGHSPTNCLAT
jgi:hypothetical protein